MYKFVLIILSLMISAMTHADSNSTLGLCVRKAVTVKPVADSKEYISMIQTGIRDCREAVSAQVAQEREAKREAQKAKRVARLQAQLAKLQK